MSTTTDKELLDLAAKAAGQERSAAGDWWSNARGQLWDPLGDDGDALRLAVQTGEPFVVRTSCVTTMGGLKEDFNPFVPGDELRATRRVITRAAAAMGKKP